MYTTQQQVFSISTSDRWIRYSTAIINDFSTLTPLWSNCVVCTHISIDKTLHWAFRILTPITRHSKSTSYSLETFWVIVRCLGRRKDCCDSPVKRHTAGRETHKYKKNPDVIRKLIKMNDEDYPDRKENKSGKKPRYALAQPMLRVKPDKTDVIPPLAARTLPISGASVCANYVWIGRDRLVVVFNKGRRLIVQANPNFILSWSCVWLAAVLIVRYSGWPDTSFCCFFSLRQSLFGFLWFCCFCAN